MFFQPWAIILLVDQSTCDKKRLHTYALVKTIENYLFNTKNNSSNLSLIALKSANNNFEKKQNKKQVVKKASKQLLRPGIKTLMI